MRLSAKRSAILEQWKTRLQDPVELKELRSQLWLINMGNMRRVYSLGDGFVLKLPRSQDKACASEARRANQREWTAWLALSRRRPKCSMLTRIYACAPDGSWLIAEKVEENRLAGCTFDERLCRFMRAFRRYYGDMFSDERCNWWSLDLGFNNFGIRNGRLVMLDLEYVGGYLKSAFLV